MHDMTIFCIREWSSATLATVGSKHAQQQALRYEEEEEGEGKGRIKLLRPRATLMEAAASRASQFP